MSNNPEFNVGGMYRRKQVYDKRGSKFEVTLIDKDHDGANLRAEITCYGCLEPHHLANKIGYVTKTPDGKQYVCEAQLPGCPSLPVRNHYGWGATVEQCLSEARALYEERLEMIVEMQDPRKALDYELRNMDYYYEMSDDFRVWSAGNAAENRMKGYCKQLGLDYNEQVAAEMERRKTIAKK